MHNEHFDIWLQIGLNILHDRKEQGMTQMQWAEKCHIRRTYMQKIETAATFLYADALHISLKKLFTFQE